MNSIYLKLQKKKDISIKDHLTKTDRQYCFVLLQIIVVIQKYYIIQQ